MLLTTFLLGGCVIVGPASISNGRMAYNEVINYTEDQQILNAIVRERYGQTFSMLTVSSVTANVKFRANAGGEFQAWGSSSSADSLVPLSVGVGYEDNPTISYTPVQGAVVLRSLVSPLAVDEGLLLLGVAKERHIVERYFYRRLNNLVVPVDGALSPELIRLQTLGRTLREAGIHTFGRAAGSDDKRPEHVVILSDYSEEQRGIVREYLDVLGVENQIVDGRRIVLPYGPRTPKGAHVGVYVETRSVYEWLRLAGSMIEVPEPHLEAGIVEPGEWSGPEERGSGKGTGRCAAAALPQPSGASPARP